MLTMGQSTSSSPPRLVASNATQASSSSPAVNRKSPPPPSIPTESTHRHEIFDASQLFPDGEISIRNDEAETFEFVDADLEDIEELDDAMIDGDNLRSTADDAPALQVVSTTPPEQTVEALQTRVGDHVLAPHNDEELFDLRQEINRKEKEIISLRDELSARERTLLDLRDRSRELERSNADLEGARLELERQLSRVEAKFNGAEVDARLMSERIQSLETQVAEEKKQHASVHEQLERQLSKSEQTNKTLVQEHEQATQQLRDANQEECARLIEQHGEKMAMLSIELDQAKQTHTDEMLRLRNEHTAEVKQIREDDAKLLNEKITSIKATCANEFQELEHEMQKRLDEADQHHESSVRELTETYESKIQELESTLKATFAAEKKDLEDQHGREIAVLGRKLADIDTKLDSTQHSFEQSAEELSQLRTKHGTLEQLHQKLEEELKITQSQLELTKNSEADHAVQLAQVEEMRDALKADLNAAVRKINEDSEILERARRAMAIGLGLLEDQKNNAVENPVSE